VTIIPLVQKKQSNLSETPQTSLSPSPVPKSVVTWVCKICSFVNPIPANFDPLLPASRQIQPPPCKACGMAPAMVDLVKAALASKRQETTPTTPSTPVTPTVSKTICPRCTFENDFQLLECEVCGARLATIDNPRLDLGGNEMRTPSPGPSLANLSLTDDITSSIKLSFRAGGEKTFHEKLKTGLVQRKWLLSGAPPIPKPDSGNGQGSASKPNLVGIARLEHQGKQQRKNNEQVIGNAFEDLEALMTSAKEIVALAESLSTLAREGDTSQETNQVLNRSVSALGLATTKDMLGSDTLYISELSRNLAEFLLDDVKGILRKEGGIMSLVDVWAVFNRARNGVELVSPTDFEKAAQMWDKLKLPIRLRQFKSGLLVVQGRDRTDEKTVAGILDWLKDLHEIPPDEEVLWDWRQWGKGVTVQEVARRFGWSIGIATEELEMAEDRGALCREQSVDGIRFWENWFTSIET
jgi:ESCRT-II complex subunit VPS36